MSKMSELDQIAQGVADHMKELTYDSVTWQISDQPVDGDNFNDLHSMVMKKAVEYLYIDVVSLPCFRTSQTRPYYLGTHLAHRTPRSRTRPRPPRPYPRHT